jgi:tRNA threonylcarbamoyladenosine biosynthesis protein TsaB
MRILLIETCTERGVIAYGNQNDILFARELPFGPSQSKYLMPYLTEALQPYGIPPPLDVIGVGIGPGSYTGIRLSAAVAQTLAYVWDKPLVGVSSLDGFVPSTHSIHYAAVLDARIGGVYFQIGRNEGKGELLQGHPQISSLEEVGKHLEGVSHLVTPFAKTLQNKLSSFYPDRHWVWEERAPSVHVLLLKVEQKWLQGQIVIPPHHLEMLYLRETEAERGKGQRHCRLQG